MTTGYFLKDNNLTGVLIKNIEDLHYVKEYKVEYLGCTKYVINKSICKQDFSNSTLVFPNKKTYENFINSYQNYINSNSIYDAKPFDEIFRNYHYIFEDEQEQKIVDSLLGNYPLGLKIK